MNEELQKALAEFVKATLAGFQAGKDFVLAEAPEVIQQLIRWKFWEATIWAVLGWMVCAAWLIALVRLRKRLRLEFFKEGNEPVVFFGLLISGFVVLIGALPSALGHTTLALQIYIAPKVWLIEWAMKQVK